MYLSDKGFDALTVSCVDWNAREKIISENIGKSISETKDEKIIINNKNSFQLGSRGCKLCDTFSSDTCTGCPLRNKLPEYRIVYQDMINKIDKAVGKGVVTIELANSMIAWKNFLMNIQAEYNLIRSSQKLNPDTKNTLILDTLLEIKR